MSNNSDNSLTEVPVNKKNKMDSPLADTNQNGFRQISRRLLKNKLLVILIGFIIIMSLAINAFPEEGVVTQSFIENLFYFGIYFSTPVLLAIAGEILNQAAGTRNPGIEGTMTISAFMTFLIVFITNNLLLSVILSGIIGMFTGFIHGFNVNVLKVRPFFSGISLNILLGGLAGFLYFQIFGTGTTPPRISTMDPFPIPGLSSIPIWGNILFKQTSLTYFAIILAIIIHITLNYSWIGLRIKACGQNPESAEVVGVPVTKYRAIISVFAGSLAGLGGCALNLSAGLFTENMVAGRGWIAFGLAGLAMGNPIGGIFASLIFGIGNSLVYRIQALALFDFPIEFLWMIPQIFTIIALFFYGIRERKEYQA